MRRIVVGTAGHIDHGKTALVAALTGIDCDRWAEEKERGITIDLGFAHLHDGDLQLGFVDVPGHERFIHNALAGLGGIRMMLLVVAADEGVMPQTREHLDICTLLEIPAGLAVLSKADLVSEELLELAQLELEETLKGTPFGSLPILPVSSLSGQGIPELKTALLELARRAGTDDGRRELPVRLPVDRAFHLRGMGVIVTGTLMTGEVRPGDSLELLPRGDRVRVRSVQVHGADRQLAVGGERTSLQLGGADLETAARGVQLVTPGCFAPGTRLLTRFTLLASAPKAIRGFVPIRFHLTSSECVGKLRPLVPSPLEPGQAGLVEIRLDRPVVAVRGDRFIVRRPSPQTTLGGGEVLDPAWRRARGSRLRRALDALTAGPGEALVSWVEERGEAGAGLGELLPRLGLPAARLEALLAEQVAEQRLLEVPAGTGHERRWIAPAAYRRICRRTEGVLKDYFKRDRLARGMPKAEALRRILPGRGVELADVYLGWLERQRILVLQGDLVNLPDRRSQLTDNESSLASSILRRYEQGGLTPPAPETVCEELRAKRQVFDGVLRYLIEGGSLQRLGNGLIISRAALDRLRDELLRTGWDRFSVPEFKNRFGLTRKWAIPLLEHFDQTRLTQRVGTERQVLRR